MKSEILLVLDIDETLIYATRDELNYSPNFEVPFYKIYKRPGLDEFLLKISSIFQIGFWSSASNHYVKNIAQQLSTNFFNPLIIWGRSRCTFEIDRDNKNHSVSSRESHYNYVKKLSKLSKKLSYSLEKIIIIDDSPHKSKYNKENAIQIKSWEGDKTDNELEKLGDFLCSIAQKKSIREIPIHQFPINK